MTGNTPDQTGKSSSRALGSRGRGESTPELDQATLERLGRLLARSADQLVRQPIPDLLVLLLAKMDAKERGQ